MVEYMASIYLFGEQTYALSSLVYSSDFNELCDIKEKLLPVSSLLTTLKEHASSYFPGVDAEPILRQFEVEMIRIMQSSDY